VSVLDEMSENVSPIKVFDTSRYTTQANARTPSSESRVADREISSKVHNSPREGVEVYLDTIADPSRGNA